ncbi:TIGR00341 family protein [Halioglobus maricola]|uniref:TIGR00341 family protein n=1 Tax=Halioglobus maricola TaxID=2601894 RepID=A0A5P9NHN0_9GAMM|nr:TIGR00341 family protein [Halioglobus maricola]QFU75292.1 TIGR00341 family protein [Halioglobus maricola]
MAELGYLVHDSTLDERAETWAAGLEFVPWSDRESVPAGATLLLWLGDEQIRDLAHLALEREWTVAALPHPDAHEACVTMGVKGEPADLVKHYHAVEPVLADALTCNGELVFSSVVIGRVLSLRPWDINSKQTAWSFFRGAIKGLGQLSLNSFKLITAKEQEISLAALGMVAVTQTRSSMVGKRFDESPGMNDGRASLVVLAPRSILSYLWFLLRLVLPGRIQFSNLPSFLGLIQSTSVHLEAQGGIEYLLDGKPVHGAAIELCVHENKMRVLPGPSVTPREDQPSKASRETLRLNHVPVDDAARAMLGKNLPLFNHASESEYRDLFVSLRENASASSSFQVLMILSVMLALTGLYANSAPVIIGAMILAPLMAPIISLAMGLARSEATLIRGPLKTLAIGVAWGLGCGVLLAWIMPFDIATPEMKARMSPTLLDLMIAVISGVAGAYAHAKEEIAKSLAGVAIAVALVPPLSVAGIGLGWGDWHMATGALLLLTTNLVGIAVAASITFLVLGFAPFQRAQKGLVASLFLIALISAPLYIAYDHLVERSRIEERVPVGELQLLERRVFVARDRVVLGDPPVISVVVSSREPLQSRHVDALKEIVSRSVERDIELEAQLHIRR